MASACTQSDVVVVDVARIDVSPSEASVLVGQQTQLTATVRASGGEPLSGRTVTWASEDPGVATADASGRVIGVAVGTATIRASSEGASGTATVRVAAGPVPSIRLNPDSASFMAVQNGATPGDRTISITNAGTGVLEALGAAVRYPAGSAAGWLTAVLGSSTAPTTIVLSADQAGLATGVYRASVDVSAPDAPNSPATVEVALTVAAPQPAIGLGTTSVSFAAAAGGANPAGQDVAVTNAGGGTLGGLMATVSFTTGQPSGWLTATLDAATAPTTLRLAAVTGALPVGVHTATVRISSSAAQNSPQEVQVTFSVGTPPPAISTSPSTLTFAAVAGQVAPTQQVAVTNAGGGSLTGLDVSVTYPGGQPSGWVTTNLAGTTAPTTLSVGASAAGLPGGTYSASVSITSPVAGNSPTVVSVTFEVTAPPAAPSGITATAASATRVNVAWTDNSADETGFRLERRVNGGAWSLLATPAANATSFIDDSAAPATTYGYRVRACRGTLCSAFSAVASATTPDVLPGVPANPVATVASPTGVDVAWDAPATGGAVATYRVERRTPETAFSLVATVSGAVRSIEDRGLIPATTYAYRVQACNPAGCSTFSPEAAATTPAMPPVADAGGPYEGIVSGASVTLDGSGSSDPDGTIATYRWEIADDGEPTILTGVSPAYSCPYAGTFAVTLEVTDDDGASASDATTIACTVPPPSIAVAPSSLTFAAVTGTTTPTQEVTITNAGGGDLTGLAASVTFPGGQPSGWLTTDLAASTAPTTLTVGANAAGLAAGTYTATVSITSATASNSPQAVNVTLDVTVPPAAPSGLSATAVAATRIDVAWTDNSNDETGFELERSADGGSWSVLTAPAANATSFVDESVLPATTYVYRIRACRGELCSAFSAEALAKTPALPPVAEAGGPYAAEVGENATLDGSGSTDPDGTIVSYQWQIDDGEEPTILTGVSPAYSCLAAGTYAVTLTVTDDDGATGGDGTTLECLAAGPLPGPPTNVQVSEITTQSVRVSWAAPTSGGFVSWYAVQRRSPTGPWVNAASFLSSSTFTRVVSGLAPSTLYRFRVQACNLLGCTASSEVSATTLPGN